MAASIQTLVAALLGIARRQGNPLAFLEDIKSQNFTSTIQGDGTVLISTSTGGTSGSFTLPAGSDPLSIVELAQLAIEIFQTGVDQPIEFRGGVPQTAPAISQLVNSRRTTSYAQFSNVQH